MTLWYSVWTLAPAELQPGDVVGDRYRLEGHIRTGGMGSVWRASHTQLEIRVAVKFISAELVGTALGEERFRREARAAARLKSPHVVVIHDYGIHRLRPYIAMELLEGEDLEQRLQRGPVPPEDAAEIIAQIANALRVAHGAGIVHRDLKPANIFMAEAGGEPLIKVLDFGIAKHPESELAAAKTSSSILIGSPFYMSPEQVRGLPLDARSDLWSCGVVAYELLTGKRPFTGANLGDLAVAICSEDPARPSTLCPELDPEFDGFFRRALARSPSARFGSALELAEAFSRITGTTGARRRELVSLRAVNLEAAHGLGRLSETLAETGVGITSTRSFPRPGRSSMRNLTAAVTLGAASAFGVLLLIPRLLLGPSARSVSSAASSRHESGPEQAARTRLPEPSPSPRTDSGNVQGSQSAGVVAESPPASTPSARPPLPRRSVVRDSPKLESDASRGPPEPAMPLEIDPVFGVPVSGVTK